MEKCENIAINLYRMYQNQIGIANYSLADTDANCGHLIYIDKYVCCAGNNRSP